MATHTSSSAQKHLAVLIDVDNAPGAIVEGLFEEIARYGVASVNRIYGDWTGRNWRLEDSPARSLHPIDQQLACIKGKNATDSSLIMRWTCCTPGARSARSEHLRSAQS